jgi:hypothetical protein
MLKGWCINVLKEKLANENYAVIANEVYNDKESSNEEVLVYCMLQRFYNKAKSEGICSINIMKDLMHIDNRNKNTLDNLQKGISDCIEKELIYNLTDLKSKELILEGLKNDTIFKYTLDFPEKYFKVYEYMYHDIFKHLHETSSNINKFALFRYFTSISRVINSESDFGYLSQTDVKFCGESRAIARYNSVLTDLKIFLYNNEYYTAEKHYNATFFGWYGDNVNFDFQVKCQVDSRNLVKVDKENIKVKVSNTQKINKTKTKIETSNKDEEIAMLKAKLLELEEEKKNIPVKEEYVDHTKLTTPKDKGSFATPKHKGLKGRRKSCLVADIIEETPITPPPMPDRIVTVNVKKNNPFDSDAFRLRKVHDFILSVTKEDDELKAKFSKEFRGRTNGHTGADIEKFEIEVNEFFKNYNNNNNEITNDDKEWMNQDYNNYINEEWRQAQ